MPLQKSIFTLLLIIAAPVTFAQQNDTLKYYLNTYDEPADRLHAVYLIKVYKEKPTDVLWKRDYMTSADHKLLSTGNCKDPLGKIKQGDYKSFDFKGKLERTGHFENDKLDGEWIGYFPSGKTESIYHYTQGKMSGLSRSWDEKGNLLDSFNLDKNGNGYGVGFYGDGTKRYEGIFADGIKKGEWKYYYDLQGSHQSMACVFEKDSLLSSKCFTQDGQPQNKDCYYFREAEFIGGPGDWVKYLIKTIRKSKYTKYLSKGEQYTVVVKFVVDKEGTITDAEVEEPGSNEKLDNIAEDIIRQSPHWAPAIQYNQPVNAYRRQPVTFVEN